MKNEDYNRQLDDLAKAAMQVILSHEGVFTNNSHEFVAEIAYDYAQNMMIARETYIKGKA